MKTSHLTFFGVALLLAACGVAPDASAPTTASTPSPLEGAFDAAAREYQVPVEVLKAIAFVETRVAMHPGAPSMTGGHGLMHLVEREDWNQLDRAARLTGVDVGRLKVDARANIRGAAAVLRHHFDQQARADTALDGRQVGDWFRAVSLYPGIDAHGAAMAYAQEVFERVELGFEVEADDGVVRALPLASEWRQHAPEVAQRRDAVKEYPGAAAWLASPHYSAGRSTYEFILIHTMQGSYAGTKSWFTNLTSRVSSHYIVRSSDGEVTQMVEHRNTAWHAQCYNGRSVGIEHEGFVQDPGRWYTDVMYRRSAALTRWIADRHGIPKTRSRIIGHVEVAPNCNTSRHTDPGSGWNWTKYMQYVLGTTPTPTTGVLIGAIYSGGNTANRISGATVTVAGRTVTSDASGVYQVTLPPGSYTATATRAGYSTATVTRTVTSGAQVWGSMELSPVASTGTLRGKVYVHNPANAADLSQAITGATVTAGGRTATSDASGNYLFTLAPGSYTVQVAKAGYQSNAATRTVTSGQTVWGSVGLSPVSMPDTQAPQVAISFPREGAQLDLGAIELKGTANDDRGAVAKVFVSLNAGAEVEVPVASGVFAVDVRLKPGTNAVAVRATDAAGNVGRAVASATFNAGVGGVVKAQGEGGAPIAGAEVELLEPGTAVRLGQATTDGSGVFSFTVGVVGVDALLVVKAPGYLTSSQTVSLPEDQRLRVDVELVPGEMTGGDFGLRFSEPQDGATVTAESVVVYGAVEGFDVAGVRVNGLAAELVGAGGFAVAVPLAVGTNVLEAVAVGVAGETVSGRMTLIRAEKTGAEPELTTSPPKKAATGGCTSVPGVSMLAALALLGALRRRARR